MEFPNSIAFKGLIDTFEKSKYIDQYQGSKETQSLMLNLTGWLRSAMYLETKTDTAFTLEKLKQNLEKECLPYEIIEVERDETDIDVEVLPTFHINPIHDTHRNIMLTFGLIKRYMMCLNGVHCDEFDIIRVLQSLHTLYNWAYGPFYKNDWDHVYTVEELNLLFQYKKIPYRFTTHKIVGAQSGSIITTYQAREVVW